MRQMSRNDSDTEGKKCKQHAAVNFDAVVSSNGKQPVLVAYLGL